MSQLFLVKDKKGITDKVDFWLELLKENGLILRKDKKVLKFIEIQKIPY